ncbi:MAG: tryptophan--tRNA ligase [Alphaproteobacteria bacterium]
MTQAKTRIFSGIQPTSNLTLGNYLGALKNWVSLQGKYDETLYCVVDLHALTVPQDPKKLADQTREIAAAFMACGIDPKKAIIFNQSMVREHTELGWLLSTITPLGWLNRMTQFKDKAGKHKERAGLGLYSYPVLMAADILLYKATHVPVGDDQKQHVELARDIAAKFNHDFGKDYFPQPEPQIFGTATRVMSLRDGTKKMSKSDPSDYSRINLIDDADTIAQKIKKAKTDPLSLPDNIADLEGRPEAKNLLNIYAALKGEALEKTCAAFAGKTFSEFKTDLTDLVVATLAPIGDDIRRFMADKAEIDAVLKSGAEKASVLAAQHMNEVRDIIGLLRC